MNATTRPTAPTFRHGAYLYTGHDAFLDGALPFIQDGLAHDEPVLGATNPTKIEMLRAALATYGPEWTAFAKAAIAVVERGVKA